MITLAGGASKQAGNDAGKLLPFKPGEQRKHTQNHGECVGIYVAGLRLPRDAGKPADQFGRAVNHDAVDDGHVAELPKPGSHFSASAREEPIIKSIKSVFLIEDVDEKTELAADFCG